MPWNWPSLLALTGKTVTLLLDGEELVPGLDPYLDGFIKRRLKKDGVTLLTNLVVSGYGKKKFQLGETTVTADMLVSCPLRRAVIPASDIPLASENGFLQTDERLQTRYPSILAIGDVNGRSCLAHMASAQGLYAVNAIKGIPGAIDWQKYPLNIYTFPEMAQIGLTEPEARRQGLDYKISEFPLTANGKALIEGTSEGVIRLVSEKKYGEVLGVQIVAPHATDMIAEASLLLEMEGTVYDLARTIHAHPTVSEIFMEAGLEALDKAIHK